MPSDDRIQLALDAVAPRIAAFRSATTAAAERVRAMLAADGGAERARAELGALGATRIDAARFAELSRGAALDAAARDVVAQAADLLSAIASAPDSTFAVTVPAGERAATAITTALASLGRAFGAVHAADLARAGRLDTVTRAELTRAYGPEHWTGAERLIAPPIVVAVNGADLHAAEIAELLDGAQQIVLIVNGPCAPAALVRLITPGTFVLQTHDSRGLEQLRACRGPALAALVGTDAACFMHDPARGTSLWRRLEIWHEPAGARKRVGSLTARQQSEEVAQLAALATQPAFTASKLGDLVPAGSDSVDRLADWLLGASGLAGEQ